MSYPLLGSMAALLAAAPLTVAAPDAGGRAMLDLSGQKWQMEGIRPGQGVREGFQATFGEVCPRTYNWNGATVPGDVYTDLWRAGEIDDPHHGRNGMRARGRSLRLRGGHRGGAARIRGGLGQGGPANFSGRPDRITRHLVAAAF